MLPSLLALSLILCDGSSTPLYFSHPDFDSRSRSHSNSLWRCLNCSLLALSPSLSLSAAMLLNSHSQLYVVAMRLQKVSFAFSLFNSFLLFSFMKGEVMGYAKLRKLVTYLLNLRLRFCDCV